MTRRSPPAPSYDRVRAWLARAVGACGAAASTSLAVQVNGLLGPAGLTPIPGLPAGVAWGLTAIGAVAGVAAAAGVAPRRALAAWTASWGLLWCLAPAWLGDPGDALLLELGAAATLLAPGATEGPPARAAILLARWIVARTFALSVVSQLTRGDPGWRDLTALRHLVDAHPQPHAGTRWLAGLPTPVLSAGTATALLVEIAIPALILTGPRGRRLAAALVLGVAVATSVVGHGGLLSWALVPAAVALLDDAAFPGAAPAPARRRKAAAAGYGLVDLGAAVVFAWGVAAAAVGDPWDRPSRPEPADGVWGTIPPAPRGVALEARWGDGPWTELTWRWRATDPALPGRWSGPHAPRLDRALALAASRPCGQHPWTGRLLRGIVAGDPAIESLIGDLRLAGSPPTEARLVRYALVSSTTPGGPLTRQPLDGAPWCAPAASPVRLDAPSPAR